MRLLRIALLAAPLAVAGCDLELDLTNPNAPTQEQALTTPDGIIASAVGLQWIYANAIDDYLVPNSLVTDEWGTGTRALLSYQSLLTGRDFDPGYDVVRDPWLNTYRVASLADALVENAPRVGLGSGFTAGIVSLAQLFKAMALGMAALTYERLPTDARPGGGVPEPRAVVLDTVLALLESARSDIANVPDAELAGFRSRVLATGLDLRNTIDAMIARYALIRATLDPNAPDPALLQRALEAAGRVSPNVLSVLPFVGTSINPIYNLAITAGYVAPLQSFVTQAEPGDRRPAYWTNPARQAGNPPDTLLVTLRKYATPNEPYPLYLPDEMKLIRAEAQARLGNLVQALALVNEVRTQTSSPLDEPVAGLPPLPPSTALSLPEMLRRIAYERRYELYMQGLRWEDTRRLPQPWNNTVAFPFLPTPTRECQANPRACPRG